MWHRLLVEEDGQSLVEYGLIVGLVSVGLVVALTKTQSQLRNIFNAVIGSLQKAASQANANAG